MIYEIANKRIKINNRYDYTDKFCKEYLSADQISPYELEAEVTQEEFEREKAAADREYPDGYIENIALYRKVCYALTKYDVFIVHGAVLVCGGEGYLFTGRSGSGKSTHARLWTRFIPDSYILNGDKPLVGRAGDSLIAYGTPWNGKEGIGVRGKAEIAAICFIEQDKKNYITEMPLRERTNRILLQLLMPKDADGVERTLAFADKLVRLPVYTLHCDISEEAVTVAYNGLIKGEIK